jgi:two-component system CheB/CheR fusion protein
MDQSFQNGSPLAPRVLRIVLVEDNLDNVHTTALLLRELGHTVEYATNGFVALDVIRRFRPDFVLCDLGLPGQNGFHVCEQIKADPELRGVKVLALTAYTDITSRERAREAGFDGYYVKPLHPDALADLFGDPRTGQPRKNEPHLP